MKDVAARAGVSVATVSHVVNGTRVVTPPTRRRVLAAISELQYVNDHVARALRTGRTTTLGLVMSAVQNPYFSDVVAAIEKATVAAGYTLFIADHHDQSDMEYRTVTELVGRRVDGLLLQPSGAPDRTLDLLGRRGLPCVMVDRSTRAELDFVGTENRAATFRLTEHLLEHGHRRIGMVSGAQGSSTTTERVDGYAEALTAHGVDTDLVVSGESTEEGAALATRRLLDLADPPTALVSGNNRMTIGVMRELTDRGLIPPEHIALAAFDDFAWSDLFRPRLTCARQDSARIGSEAVRLLLARIGQPDRAAESVHVEASLRVRESCGCPAHVEAAPRRPR